MKQRTKIAVVILNWNGKSFLEKFLPSVINSLNNQSELWVADNASKDDSLEFLSANYPQVKQLLLKENYGFAGGYNKALQQIDAEYYVLLNSDVEVDVNYLTILTKFMDENPEYHACQPKILSHADPKFFEYAGAVGGYLDALGFPFCRGRIFSVTEKDDAQYDDIVDVFWATGACLFIRSEVYHKLGGLDELFFAHMEEIDLCWRIWSNAGKIAVIPESKVFHVGGGSLPRQSARKTYLNFRNNHFLIYKNYPRESLKKVMRIRFWLDLMAAFKFLLAAHFADFKAVFKARRDFRKMKSSLKVSDSLTLPPVMYRGSIVKDYYWKGKKRFSQLEIFSDIK